jgi:hypothetical protein
MAASCPCTHQDLPGDTQRCPSRIKPHKFQKQVGLAASMHLVLQLHGGGPPEQPNGDVCRDSRMSIVGHTETKNQLHYFDNIWISLSSAMALSEIPQWEVVQETYESINLEECFSPVASQDPFILLRGRLNGRRRLFVASPTFDGFIYRLGDGSYVDQLQRLGELADDAVKWIFYQDEVRRMKVSTQLWLISR